MLLAEKTTRNACKFTEEDFRRLKQDGHTEENILEAAAVTALFNDADRMADALGAPMEGFQEMMAKMAGN